MWTRKIYPPTRWRTWLTIGPLITACCLAVWLGRIDERLRSPHPITATLPYDEILATKHHPTEIPLNLDRAEVPQLIQLRRGQTLGSLLVGDLGLAPTQAKGVVEALDGYVDVRKIQPGDIGVAYFAPSAELAGLRFEVAGKGWVELKPLQDNWARSVHEFSQRVETRRIEGEVTSSLESAIRGAGGRAQLAYAMSHVLQWDLDFNRDLRIGDRFQLLYEEEYLDGEFSGLGEILALVYTNRGRRLEAYSYGSAGYYDADGRPLQKMFLRSPLPFTRITSGFTMRRFHPILKVNRPHYGVDYGAPKGTPVRVTAGGVVAFAGRSGGAGKMVKVRHTNGYESSYLHLSGYASGVRSGRRVAQGDVIGYVGSTGLSTGPHLDYRVKRNGRWLNPLSLKSESIEPIPAHEQTLYYERRDALRLALETGEPLAAPEPPLPVSSATIARWSNGPMGEIGR